MIERMRRLNSEISIVVFSRLRPAIEIRQVLANGANAFVSKAVGLDYVVEACRAVSEGKRYVDPQTSQALRATSDEAEDVRSNGLKNPEDRLSMREREVLRLLAQGLNIREIAQRFQRSAKTISVQKCAAMSKLGLRKEIELALYLAKHEGDL
jgi:two-component system capsular synthesis response regulator RcsB